MPWRPGPLARTRLRLVLADGQGVAIWPWHKAPLERAGDGWVLPLRDAPGPAFVKLTADLSTPWIYDRYGWTGQDPEPFGLVMIGIGVFALAVATWQFRQSMKRLRAHYPDAPFSLSLILAGLIVAGVLGFYFQWFTVSTTTGTDHSQVQVTVDKEKLKEDEEKAKQKMQEAGQALKEKAKEVTGNE